MEHRKGINKTSKKMDAELLKRRQLKMSLIYEHGEVCMTCNNEYKDWRGISLSHIIPLSRGGNTTRDNCLLECFPCHELYEKHPKRRTE